MSTKTVKPANAGAITRMLKAAGIRHGEQHTTAVKGYYTFTEGVRCEQVMDYASTRQRAGSYRDGSPRYTRVSNNTPTGAVMVEYQYGGWDKRDQAERNEHTLGVLTRAAELLRSKGFEVEVKRNAGTSATPYLSVVRRDADGKIVRF